VVSDIRANPIAPQPPSLTLLTHADVVDQSERIHKKQSLYACRNAGLGLVVAAEWVIEWHVIRYSLLLVGVAEAVSRLTMLSKSSPLA
ncbi:hypothetical protein PENTCL1PPCAC_9429, partial [Pristionchus entomophagus]